MGLRLAPCSESFFCCSLRIMAFIWRYRPGLTYNDAVIAIVVRILFLAGRVLKPDDYVSLFFDFFPAEEKLYSQIDLTDTLLNINYSSNDSL